jgi:hypothetical protein
MNQGQPAPFDPNAAAAKFARTIREQGGYRVLGDAFAGTTFRWIFQREGVMYEVSEKNKSELYEAMEPLLNAKQVVLPDVSILEQQLLGLRWRGNKIDHEGGEHDDWANCAAGIVAALQPRPARGPDCAVLMPEGGAGWQEGYWR